ncbi:uncharacterized protein BCR38DRAFT_504377 [Pseudomassariella vexata]|uniref:Rhodopsin domain-containing protein n=1 Tax=Pseudomassariella vexata TaxID=1141098 RepID=A0A1Y2DDQ7_9PEZI|nr:uncharacterized protein BCR38DRAFT_504377 [Pseudomassariella vexata]ORY57256.1 hypothetical protein BCR38DRAFT_504377 [Pseudomassariella vexata]
MPSLAGIATQDKGPAILIIIIIATSLSTAFAAARLFVRGKLLGRLHLDEYLIAVSVIVSWVAVAFQILAIQNGNGKHIQVLTYEQQKAIRKWTMLGFTPFLLSFTIPKLATVTLLTQLLAPTRTHRIFLWFLSIFCIINMIPTVVTLFLECPHDIPKNMDLKCIPISSKMYYDIYSGGFSAFVDLYLALYPAIILSKIRLSLYKKISLSAALGFGFISAIVATYKCTRLTLMESPDFTYDLSDVVIWTSVEGNTIIIAACIPVLKPLVDLFRGKFDPSLNSRRHNYRGFYSRSRSTPKVNVNLGRINVKKQQPPTLSFDGNIAITRAESRETMLGLSEHRLQEPKLGQIRRTDVVVVEDEDEYEDEDEQGHKFEA